MSTSRACCWFFTALLLLSCSGPPSLAGENPDDRSPRVVQPSGHSSTPSRKSRGAKYAEGRVLVQFNEGTTKEEMETVMREVGLEVSRPLSSPNLYLMKIRGNKGVRTALEQLKGYPAVKHAEPDFMITID